MALETKEIARDVITHLANYRKHFLFCRMTKIENLVDGITK